MKYAIYDGGEFPDTLDPANRICEIEASNADLAIQEHQDIFLREADNDWITEYLGNGRMRCKLANNHEEWNSWCWQCAVPAGSILDVGQPPDRAEIPPDLDEQAIRDMWAALRLAESVLLFVDGLKLDKATREQVDYGIEGVQAALARARQVAVLQERSTDA